MILHIDMDAFFASVEQHLNPRLQGKPVIVGVRNNKYHTVVSAASYEAKAYGIKSGMPSHEAFKICPHAEFVSSDFSKYADISQEIFDFLQQFSPYVTHSTIDEFDLEISGLEAFFGQPLDLGKLIKKRIREAFGLNCSIGIAATWILAKLGTKIRKPDGLILITEANLDSLISGLAVEKICGIGPALTAHLAALGIITCDQLKTTPREVLVNNIGQSTGHWLYLILRPNEELSTPQNHPPMFVAENKPLKSISHSRTLSKEISNQKTIFAWLRMLSEMVAERARKTGVLGHTTSLWLSSKNESSFTQKTCLIPTNDGWEIFARSRAIYGQKKTIFKGIRALGVSISSLIPDCSPPLLIEQKKREVLLKTMDKINARYGDWTLSPAVLTPVTPK